MSHPAHSITRAHPGRRTVAVLAATLLLAAGITAYLTRTAPPAHAQTTEIGGLDASVDPGSVTVGLATVSAAVTYTCTDTSAPGGDAQLRVDFDQNGNDTSGELSVPCGTSQVNQTQTVTAVQVGMSGSQEITAIATLDDGNMAATDTANLAGVVGPAYAASLHGDPEATFPGDGTVTVIGYYNCASTGLSGVISITATQVPKFGDSAVGAGTVGATTCDGTNQPFSVNIESLSGFPFRSDIFSNPVKVRIGLMPNSGPAVNNLEVDTQFLLLD